MKALLQKYSSRTLLNAGLFVFILILVLLVVMDPGKEPEKKTTRLTELKQADIKSIDLKRASDADLRLEKRNGIWYITKPYHLAANEYRAHSISALAETLSHLQYDAGNIDLKKFKLDKPDVTITLNNNTVLEVGGVDPIKNRRYVKNGDTLHLVNDTFYYQIIGKVTAYISYQILPPEIKLSKLVLPKFTLSQHDGDWRISPADKTISSDSINEFVNEWRHAQSLEISEYKGKPGKTRIQVYQQDKTEPLVFSLQKTSDSVFLIRPDIKLRYKLSDEIADKLQNLPPPPSPENLGDDEPNDTDKQQTE